MDTGSLVERQIEDGRYLLEKLVSAGFDVSAAAWVKTADDDKWALYVVSKTVDEQGSISAYAAVKAALGAPSPGWLSASDLCLVRTDTPFGRSLLEIQKQSGGQIPRPIRLRRIGDVMALEGYLYPLIVPGPPEQRLTPPEVVQKVVGLMSRTGVSTPSRITLRDGTTFLGLPFGLELSGDTMHVKFAVEGQQPPRVYPVETIRTIE